MKVPSGSSILLATLAVSSSSSALVPPSESHQEAPLSSASSALIASSSSGSLASYQTGFSQRELALESTEQRAILDILPLACQLAHTLTDNLPTPIPALIGVLCSPSPKDGKGSPNQAKAHKELSKISDTLQQAVFVSGVSIPSSSTATVSPSNGVDGDNGRVNAANSTSFASSVPTPSSAAIVSPSNAVDGNNGRVDAANSTSFVPTPSSAAIVSPSNAVDGNNGRVNAANSASFASSVPTPSSAAIASPSNAVDGNNGRVDAANSASSVPTPSESMSASLISSASSTAWRFQPTPANSPYLPVDDIEGR